MRAVAEKERLDLRRSDCTVRIYCGDPVFPTADDLIMGFKNHSKNMAALQEWAIFMLVYCI